MNSFLVSGLLYFILTYCPVFGVHYINLKLASAQWGAKTVAGGTSSVQFLSLGDQNFEKLSQQAMLSVFLNYLWAKNCPRRRSSGARVHTFFLLFIFFNAGGSVSQKLIAIWIFLTAATDPYIYSSLTIVLSIVDSGSSISPEHWLGTFGWYSVLHWIHVHYSATSSKPTSCMPE